MKQLPGVLKTVALKLLHTNNFMLIKPFYSWEEAQKYATENNPDLGLFSIKDGEHNTDYKFLYQVFEPIDLTDFLDDCYVIEINEFEKSVRDYLNVKASYYDAKSDLAEAKGDEVGSCRYFEKMDETMDLVIDLQRRLKERGVDVDEA